MNDSVWYFKNIGYIDQELHNSNNFKRKVQEQLPERNYYTGKKHYIYLIVLNFVFINNYYHMFGILYEIQFVRVSCLFVYER